MTSSHRLQVVQGSIERRIYIIRGEKVVLDSDLAVLYGIQPKRLNDRSNVIDGASRAISCSDSLRKQRAL